MSVEREEEVEEAMLRPTLARAFGPEEGKPTADEDPSAPRDRHQAVTRMFTELHRELARRIARGTGDPVNAAGEADAAFPAGSDDGADRPPLRLGAQRARLEGVEFVLEGEAVVYRFLHTLQGVVRVQRLDEAGPVPDAMLGVQRADGGFRPIRKPLGGARTGFEFTSVPALADAYLKRAGSV